jgi:hypothetical protein
LADLAAMAQIGEEEERVDLMRIWGIVTFVPTLVWFAQ